MKKTSLALLFIAAISATNAYSATAITSYDITNTRPSGSGNWTHQYSGTITRTTGSLYNYNGGSGSINDNLIPTSESNNHLFAISDNSTITLHLSNNAQISFVDIIGGDKIANNWIPGILTGATFSFGGKSASLISDGWGTGCNSGLCNDRFSFTGTELEGAVGNRITLSNFQTLGNKSYYNIGEIGVTAAVPEPESYVLMIAGFAVIGFAARLKRRS